MLEYVGTGIRVRWNAGLAAAARRRVRRLAATTSETGDRTRERPFDEREFRRDVLSIFGRTAGPSANRHWTGVRKNTNLTHSLALAKRDVCLSYSFSLSRERERERRRYRSFAAGFDLLRRVGHVDVLGMVPPRFSAASVDNSVEF